ncbi:hypothetical protein CALCODRAFT_489895 [Calocera cornea HHB12733]|uniref:Membrane-associated proteins in eicosanoid and glutathione metabolism n=1 Tax=Calocera cornea HHB12733 TaxID=1353952 RepID=A0A165K0U4_9BASI|nr:hypothetical protein CALCODRAFT_489895 [Calocera cornea HHB12733]
MSFLSHLTLDTPGLALYALPAAFFVGLAPHVQKIMLFESSGIKIDNRSPRSVTSAAEKKGIPAPLLAKADRLAAAHQNGIENFPLFAAAVLAGTAAGLPAAKVNLFAGAYLGLRVVYNLAYANQTTLAIAGVRSLAFWIGTGWAFYIMCSAGSALGAKA